MSDSFEDLLAAGLKRLRENFADLPDARLAPPGMERAAEALAEAAGRMGDNYPYFHPLYAGQMLKPPHPVARAAYALAMELNPNNHALDGGRASSRMEMEAVREIAEMFGWSEFLGHLTSGGTFANLEALWVAGQMAPGKKVVASEQAHYTHSRISAVLKLPYASVATDARGRMDLGALEAMLIAGDCGTVVATLGTTAVGAVDPLDGILELRKRYGFRLHVDAAYGGYFRLASNLGDAARLAFEKINEADSIVVDPHKHGLQPYGCGCVLFRDPGMGQWYKHESPYTYFTSQELHLGEISLECSRAGASAVALWTTQRVLPLERGGDFARGLEQGREAALRLHTIVREDPRFVAGPAPELDIVVWCVKAESLAESSRRAQEVFDRAAEQGLHLALAHLPARFFAGAGWTDADAGSAVTCLRSVLMKPEHLEWVEEIGERIKQGPGTGDQGPGKAKARTRAKANAEAKAKAGVVLEVGVVGAELVMQTDTLRATVLPALGGKIASLRWLAGDVELLQQPLAPYAARTMEMGFDESDASGIDECLPSVAQCAVYTPGRMVHVPDHGDFWRLPWECVQTSNEFRMAAMGVSLPLRLERVVTLDESGLKMAYRVINAGEAPVEWAWAAHPLLAAERGDRILLPASVKKVQVEGSGQQRLGKKGAVHAWPLTVSSSGASVDLSVAGGIEDGFGDKLFTASPVEGWAALERVGAGVRIEVQFDAQRSPWLGLWLCYGGWPEGKEHRQQCVAIEPCTAPVDSLAEAMAAGQARRLEPGESDEWGMRIAVSRLS